MNFLNSYFRPPPPEHDARSSRPGSRTSGAGSPSPTPGRRPPVSYSPSSSARHSPLSPMAASMPTRRDYHSKTDGSIVNTYSDEHWPQHNTTVSTSATGHRVSHSSKSSSQLRSSVSQSGSGSNQTPFTGPSTLRHCLFPPGDERNNDITVINEFRGDMMVKWLYEQQLRKKYVTIGSANEGAVLKKARGDFMCYPPQMAAIPGSLYSVAPLLNFQCCMTVTTPVIRAIQSSLHRESGGYVPLWDGLRIQILQSMQDLPNGQLHHFAAFIKDAQLMVVWDDNPENLIQRAQELEFRLVEIIWGNGNDEHDQGEPSKEERPVRMEAAFTAGCSLAISAVCLSLGVRALVIEALVDGNWTRLALAGMAPLHWFISFFFFQSLVGSIYRILGPIGVVRRNSKNYSGKPPRRLDRRRHFMPHLTFQVPVYKEGLHAVIKPTVMSLKAAISTYEMQGGSANIFVNDDGMQLLPHEEAQQRRDFYDEHNIGWVARPPHKPYCRPGSDEKTFLRRGKFKKASNMNYALHVSNRVEDKLSTIPRHAKWTQDEETAAYYQCLADILLEDEGRTWVEGNIRMGDYILLVDSDTRVPRDCLLDAVSEMEQSPEVAIIQYTSGIMNVTQSYFENAVTWFTHLIYTAITFAVASGDGCPFVGHNAVLRWRAIQEAAAYTDEDGYEKYWSESHVSEDFDMALRLQAAGYLLRFAAYTGDGFQEGVSLTVYDELARWEKYAFGCNELLFHPLRLWIVKGPFTPLFRQFVCSCIQLPTKLSIIAYIGTYYAIAGGWLLGITNFFITGWYWGMFDKYYLDSFAIIVSILAVFTVLGNLSLAVLRYRLGQRSLLGSLLENFKWFPLFIVFLGGLSIHLAQAILSHFFEIDIVWGATAKEAERVHFGQEVVRILRRFKFTFLLCLGCTTVMLVCSFVVPYEWRIDTFSSIFPLALTVGTHLALPILLNPALMMYTW